MAKVQMGKGVKNRSGSGDYVTSSAKTNAEGVGAELERRWPLPEGLSPGSVAKVMLWLAGNLDGAGGNLKEKELAYVAELADDVVPRQNRDDRGATAWALLTSARSRIEQLLGDKGLGLYGLWEPVPQIPGDISHRLSTTIRLLEEHPVKIEDPFGAVFDTTVVVAKLREALTPMDEALGKVLAEERERQDAINARDKALGEWTEAYQGVATTLSGLFQLAGRVDLADRLRPTARRAAGISGLDVEEDGEPAADGTEATTTNPDETI